MNARLPGKLRGGNAHLVSLARGGAGGSRHLSNKAHAPKKARNRKGRQR